MSSFSRRDFLRFLSGSAFIFLGGRWGRAQASSAPVSRALTPELTEGPYYIDLERIRRDITEGKPGVPLRLKLKVVQSGEETPLAGAAVDVWHCDAQGVYSGFNAQLPPPGAFGKSSPGRGPVGPPPMDEDDDEFSRMLFPPPGFGPGHAHQPDNKLTFLRGVQITGPDGVAEIDTIYPGWYQGRATHLHVRVHLGGRVADGRYQGGHISHTGQIFMPDGFSDRIYQLPAYAKKESGRTPLEDDDIFLQGGRQVTRVSPLDPSRLESGLVCNPLLVIDSAAQPARI
jgi:protocatechuate 3,4-dioxygenase beta subunit